MDGDDEKRIQCALLIQDIGSRIPTTQVVITSALVYMQRFYQTVSPSIVKPVMVAITALYVASKAEDNSRKLSQLVQVAYGLLRTQMPPEDSSTYRQLASNIRKLEASMIIVIGFDNIDVKHPLAILVSACKAARIPRSVSDVAYVACSAMLHLTTIALRHSMEALAAGSLYYAARRRDFQLASVDPNWTALFSPNLNETEVQQVANHYVETVKKCDERLLKALRNSLRLAVCRTHSREDANYARRASLAGKTLSNPDMRFAMSGGGGSQQSVPAHGGVYGENPAHMRMSQSVSFNFSSSSSQPPPQAHQRNPSGLSHSSSSVNIQGSTGNSSSAAASKNSLYNLF